MTKAGWPFQKLIDELYLPYFHREGEKSLAFLASASAPRQSFMSAYRHLEPFENQTNKEKIKMYRYVIELFPKMPNPERMVAAKCIYTIGTIL